jgi:hypothetical protein
VIEAATHSVIPNEPNIGTSIPAVFLDLVLLLKSRDGRPLTPAIAQYRLGNLKILSLISLKKALFFRKFLFFSHTHVTHGRKARSTQVLLFSLMIF